MGILEIFSLNASLRCRTAGVIDCLLGQISQSSVDLSLNSDIRLIPFPDAKSADMSRQDFTLNEMTRLV